LLRGENVWPFAIQINTPPPSLFLLFATAANARPKVASLPLSSHRLLLPKPVRPPPFSYYKICEAFKPSGAETAHPPMTLRLHLFRDLPPSRAHLSDTFSEVLTYPAVAIFSFSI